MSKFSFDIHNLPFPRWWGPFSPARGRFSGFRFHDRRLGTWVENDQGREFWSLVDTPGATALGHHVLDHWGGGRVLLLPDGLAIKPLQADSDVGKRVLIGRFQGSIVLERPGGKLFDMSEPGSIAPGQVWPGPKTTGLECAIKPDGSLHCDWYHPASWGREEISKQLVGPDRRLANGFRAARPHDQYGRVRVTANGHVITNRQNSDGNWVALYVGRIDSRLWPRQQEWIERGNA